MRDFRVCVAPTGARRQKSDHPALPTSIPEIAATARSCFDAGATELHLHVRDDDGAHSLDAGRYREAIAAVAATAPQMEVQISTESAGVFDVATQLACLEDLRPAAASISVREVARDEKRAARIYALSAESEVRVQHILYSPACITQMLKWKMDGVIRAEQSDVIFVLGQYQPALPAQVGDLGSLLEALKDREIDWTVCAFGHNEQSCLLHAIGLGGNARVGFENNIHRPDGAPLSDNAASVAALVRASADNPAKET